MHTATAATAAPTTQPTLAGVPAPDAAATAQIEARRTRLDPLY